MDENLATRWVAGGSGTFAVDLGKEYLIEAIEPLFVYYDYFNLYRIYTSDDNQKWDLYFDQSKVAKKAHAPVVQNQVRARYVKIEIVRGEEEAAALTELRVMGPVQN